MCKKSQNLKKQRNYIKLLDAVYKQVNRCTVFYVFSFVFTEGNIFTNKLLETIT